MHAHMHGAVGGHLLIKRLFSVCISMFCVVL